MFDDMLQYKTGKYDTEGREQNFEREVAEGIRFHETVIINSLNMLDRFLKSVGERVQSFSENIGFGGRGRNML